MNTTISDEHDLILRGLSAHNNRTKAEALVAAIRLLLDFSVYSSAHRDKFLDEVPHEMNFSVKRLDVGKCRKLDSLSAVTSGSTVLVDARVFFYAYVWAGFTSVREWKPDEEVGVSKECLSLIRAVRNGDVVGYTTAGELARLSDLLNNLESARVRFEIKEASGAPYLRRPAFMRIDKWIILREKRLREYEEFLKQNPTKYFYTEEAAEAHSRRVGHFIAGIVKSGFQILDEGPEITIRALATGGTFRDSMFLAAASQLQSDTLFIATASDSIAKQGGVAPIVTPSDLRPGVFEAAPPEGYTNLTPISSGGAYLQIQPK